MIKKIVDDIGRLRLVMAMVALMVLIAWANTDTTDNEKKIDVVTLHETGITEYPALREKILIGRVIKIADTTDSKNDVRILQVKLGDGRTFFSVGDASMKIEDKVEIKSYLHVPHEFHQQTIFWMASKTDLK